jgi:hypothetical protein
VGRAAGWQKIWGSLLRTFGTTQPRLAFFLVTNRLLISWDRVFAMFLVPDDFIVPHFGFSSLVCYSRETQKFFATPLTPRRRPYAIIVRWYNFQAYAMLP